MNTKRERRTEVGGASVGSVDLGAACPVDFDAELQRYSIVLRQAFGICRPDRVLDIGCGTGRTTRDAARLAAAGHALGVDISAAAIAQAREAAEAEGLENVRFEQADAATHGFPAEH